MPDEGLKAFRATFKTEYAVAVRIMRALEKLPDNSSRKRVLLAALDTVTGSKPAEADKPVPPAWQNQFLNPTDATRR